MATPAPTPAAPPPTAEAANDTTPLPAPPAEKTETMGKAPSPHHSWVHGFWYWDGRAYAWHAGYWDDDASFATVAPPALKVERAYVAPGAAFIYLPGYWHWAGKEYLWAPGHWAMKREGFAYTHPSYVEEKGHWMRRGFGWEKEDAAFKKRYDKGWDRQGEIWVRHAELADFVKRGEREGWLRKR